METVSLIKRLFIRYKPWHFYSSVVTITIFTCFMLFHASPNTGDDSSQRASEEFSFGFENVEKSQTIDGYEDGHQILAVKKEITTVASGKMRNKIPRVSSWSLSQNPDLRHRDDAVKRGPYEIFLEKPIINPHNFSYLINQPTACLNKPIHLVITTPSAPGNFFRRMKSRRAQQKETSGVKSSPVIRHLFFLGATTDKRIQAKIKAESNNFNDIIQEDYLDVYKNITFKAVQMLKWVNDFCPNSRYVVRLDDDVMANLVKLLSAMGRAHQRFENFVMGTVKRGWVPCKIEKCKTTKEEYPYATLPPFALGGALGYPTSSVKRLYEATLRVKWFRLDDVFVTAMCAPVVNVTLLEDADFTFKHHAW